MSFAAKFGGICAKCAGRIPAGSQVNYDGKAIRHAPRCPAKGTVVEVPAPAPREDDKVSDETKVLGRATYKGKQGYLILWMGTTKKGEAAKLAFRDGSKVFWADRSEIKVEKTYEARENYRSGREEHMTFGKLNRLAKEFAAEKAAEEKAQAEATKARAEEQAAREAKAKATGKTVAEIMKEERNGCRDFTRSGRASVIVGETVSVTDRKTGNVWHGVVQSVGAAYNHTEDECEDMDCFCREYGWRTPYTAREIEATYEQIVVEMEQEAAKRLAELADGVSGEWAHDPTRAVSGLRPEIKAEITERVRVWRKVVGYSVHQAWRTNIGLLSEHPVYDDDATWRLLRWDAMTPADAEIVRAAREVA